MATQVASGVRALGLVVAGEFSDILDRLARGFVAAVIDVHSWPVFNVADIAIVVRAVLPLRSKPSRPWRAAGAGTDATVYER